MTRLPLSTRTNTATPARREWLLEAALRCFCRRGYDATTIEDIVNESGASIGSIYHHFGDKSGIAAALYEQSVRGYQESAAPAVENAGSIEQSVRVGVTHYLAWMEEHEKLARFMICGRHADFPANDEIRELIVSFIDRISEWLIAAQRRGELRRMAPGVAIALWNGPAREYARAWLARPGDQRLTDGADALAEGAWRSLRP